MKNTILTLGLVLVSILSFSQMREIKTDTLSRENSIVQLDYHFYYNDEFMMFGREKEATEDYTMFKFQDSNQKDIGGCIYDIHKINDGQYLYLSKQCGMVMISKKDKSFIFY